MGLGAPLNGVRVVSFEQAVAMPYCSFVLAELGADVVKIERTGGEVIRGWDDAARGLSTGFVWVNAGKRDIALDVGVEAGRDVAQRLATGADVFLENFAPGVVDRLGLGYDDLRPANPRLVYCSLSGYGQTGPFREVKAYDLLVQGEAGVLLTNGYPDAPAKVGLPIADLVGGSNAAIAVLTALFDRERTGEGTYLDVGMFEGMLAWLGYFPQYHWHTGAEPPRSGMRHQYLSPYGPYMAADGHWVNLVVASAEHWTRFCGDVVRRPEWVDDPRFATIADRKAHRAELEKLVEAAIATEPSRVWLDRLSAAGLPAGEVRTIGEVLAHPQIEARDLVVEADSPVGPLPLVRFPVGNPERERRVPGLGEDTDEILGEVGYSAREIASLRAGGIVA